MYINSILSRCLKKLSVFTLAMFFLSAQSQENTDSEKFNWLDISGFISHSMKYDSRQTVAAREGELLLFPKPIVNDKNGNDLNGFGKLQMFNLHSRIRFSMSGRELNGFKIGAALEYDFFGSSNPTIATARLRHAYISLKNEKLGFIFGQTWHPTFFTDCYPGVIAWGAGIPVQPFSRAPQIRISYTPVQQVEFSVSALSQRDFSNSGPMGSSGDYLRNSGLPEVQARLISRFENGISLGVVGGYKTIAPRLQSDSLLANKETISSYNIGGFGKFQNKKLVFKLHGIYGQNLSNLLLIGGYGVKEIDPATDFRTYENYESLALWSELEYKFNHWSVGFFAGYVAAPDHKNKHPEYYYGLGNDIESLIRWSPRLVYSKNKLIFSLEISNTTANYTDFYQNDQLVAQHSATNNRFIFTSIYKF